MIQDTLRELAQREHMSTRPEYLQHPVIRGCGHKYVAGHQPRHRNCVYCWVALFRNDQQLTETVAEAIKEIGHDGIEQIQGRKFLQHYNKYLVLLESYERATGE